MKRILVTPSIQAALNKSFDGEVKADDYYVFEASAVTSRPIQKKGSLFNKGVVVQQTLLEMADYVNQDNVTVPLIVDHSSFGEESLPHGQVFSGKVYPTDDGFHELKTLFAMPNPETDKNQRRAALTNDIDTGILKEVSSGMAFKKIISVNTGYDFLAGDSETANPYLGLDDEGNKMGEDGHYVNCVGIARWSELSLVRTGASPGASVSSTGKNRLAGDLSDYAGYEKLAASGMTTDQSVLFLSSDFGRGKTPKPKPNTEGDLGMDEKLLASLGTTQVELGTVKAEVANLAATNAKLTTELGAATTEVATLTASLAEATTAKEKAETELEAAKKEAPEGTVAELKSVTDFIDAHFSAAVTASKKSDVKADSLTAKLAFIKNEGINLHQIVGAGEEGRSVGTPEDDKFDAATSAILKANSKGAK